jgi:hypothetical protein
MGPDSDLPPESQQAAHKNNMKRIICVVELNALFARLGASGVW